ncbi:hypothetical protein VCHENC02_4220B, partial [Vibrio harveyi]
DRFNSSRYAQW